MATGTLDAATAAGDGRITVDGDPADLQRLIGLLARVDPGFSIVTP
ncbi:MAG: alkyl sulfatase C-terminal domain-containing protein [Ilumatobacteraceae bacterium]